jgi:hypothetical protein
MCAKHPWFAILPAGCRRLPFNTAGAWRLATGETLSDSDLHVPAPRPVATWIWWWSWCSTGGHGDPPLRGRGRYAIVELQYNGRGRLILQNR